MCQPLGRTTLCVTCHLQALGQRLHDLLSHRCANWAEIVRGTMHHNLNLNWLRTFEAAARHLSFTAASKEPGLTQSAVSLQVKSLVTLPG